MTVVPRLYKALASPRSSNSKSPWTPEGGGDWEERGESGACELSVWDSGLYEVIWRACG